MKQDLFSMLDTFRQTHPTREITWKGQPYTYLVGGQGKSGLFLLPGGLGIGEPFFPHMLDLEKQFKVIAPSYPAVPALDELAEGIDQIARTEGVIPYSIVGQSAGGLLAQVLVRNYPQHVENVILTHTSAVSKDIPGEEIANRITGMKKRLRLLQLTPYFLIRRKLLSSIGAIVKTMHSDELPFWEKYFGYVFGMRTRRDQIAMTKLLIDFASNYRFTPEDLDNWPGRIMIIDSDSDISIPQVERETVRALYPKAEIHTLDGLGHLGMLSERDRYLKLFRTFLVR